MRLVALVSAALIAATGLSAAPADAQRHHGRQHVERRRVAVVRHVERRPAYHRNARPHYRAHRVVCNRVWYHHHRVRNCRTIWS